MHFEQCACLRFALGYPENITENSMETNYLILDLTTYGATVSGTGKNSTDVKYNWIRNRLTGVKPARRHLALPRFAEIKAA